MNNRSRRLAERLRQELADIVWREMRDPRVAGLSFTAVEVTADLEHAKVWFTRMPGSDPAEAEAALRHAAGYLRTELARRMQVRTVPRLNFVYDESVVRAARLSELIDQAVAEDRRHHPDD